MISADYHDFLLCVQKAQLPRIEELFIDLAEFIVQNRDVNHANGDAQNLSKKRKLNASQGAAAGDSAEKTMFEAWKQSSWGALPDISFSIPQRKKLRLEIGFLPEQGLRARNTASDEIEFAVHWKDIREFLQTDISTQNICEGLRLWTEICRICHLCAGT